MKQLMVLIATIVLGVSISGIVLGFGSTANKLKTTVATGIDNVNTKYGTEFTSAVNSMSSTTPTEP